MAEALHELLVPYLTDEKPSNTLVRAQGGTTTKYLNRLSTLHVEALNTTEPESLTQATQSNNLSIQSLSARSNASLVTCSDHLLSLSQNLPRLASSAEQLKHEVPRLDEESVGFAEKYSKSTENKLLDRRKMALLMARNVDRLSDILDLPTLLSSSISSSTSQGSSNTSNYASALDLHSHIKRLHLLYHESPLIRSVYAQTEDAMQDMTSNLISSLRSQNIKLATGMRTIGWLRRIAPELDGSGSSKEGSLGALFLVCRLATLVSMLSALEPLRDLADQETALRQRDMDNGNSKTSKDAWSHGQQTERYLKRYIEIFREHSFSIISMYKSIFPSAPDSVGSDDVSMKMKNRGLKPIPSWQQNNEKMHHGAFTPVPSALATFPLHLVNLIADTLKEYLPNVRDKTSRESLLTQVLYCAGSLGRLGGDFSLILTSLDLDEDDEEPDAEWTNVMKKHRVLASKLEKMASGAT